MPDEGTAWGSEISLGRQHEIDGIACGIHSSVEVRPVAGNSDIGLIHTPGAIRMPTFATKPLIQNGRITLDPTPDGNVIHRQSTLRHHLLQISVAQRITQVPPDAKNDDHVLKVSPTEQRRPILAHRFTLAEPPVFLCNRSVDSTEAPTEEFTAERTCS